jgi:hypothetical protein
MPLASLGIQTFSTRSWLVRRAAAIAGSDVYDEFIPLHYRTLDFIQLTQEGHAMIAAALLPRVMEILDRRRSDVPAAEMHPGPRRRGDTGL